MKTLFYDTETTGLNYWEHEMHQIAGLIIENDDIIDTFNFNLRPLKNNIKEEALAFSKVSKSDILMYPHPAEAYSSFRNIFKKHGKLMLAGYNIAAFDNLFLKQWFIDNQSDLYKYVYSNCLDVMVLASQYLLNERESMNSFSLRAVAKKLNIPFDDKQLHNSIYDIKLTYEIYKIVSQRA